MITNVLLVVGVTVVAHLVLWCILAVSAANAEE